MRRSVLLYMNGLQECRGFVDTSVKLAKWWQARLRCLTLLDTRHLVSLTATSESALDTSGEISSLFLHEHRYTAIKSQLSQACVAENLDFEIRGLRGDPFRLLPAESRFHDLTLTVYPCDTGETQGPRERILSPHELLKLVQSGVNPMLILRNRSQSPGRILLVYDGTAASLRAIRTFVQQGFFPHADMRLLSLGNSEAKRDERWRELHDYCRTLAPDLETGYLNETKQNSLLAYTEKWQADLLVAGTNAGQFGLKYFRSNPLCRMLERLPVALFVMN